ncbi:MAG: porin [Burkholderiales bacterium]|nr:porin [Burkholderiales bacterium]
MKLSKVALALAATTVAGIASAQTANVTLYGYINTSIEINRGSQGANSVGKAVNSLSVNRMTANSSRFGFRGRENLGGGTYAHFQLENSFGSDDGTLGGGVMFGREAWVGLGNPAWGEVKVGYGLTPYDDVFGLSHQNIGSTGAQNRNNGVSGGPGFGFNQLFTNYGRGGTSGASNTGHFDARAANAISYATPNMGGFTLRTMYSLIEEQAASPKARLWDTAAIYSNGPITVGLTYAMHKDFGGLAGVVTGAHDQDALRGYARYNFGVARIDGAYEVARYKLATGTLKMKYFDVAAQVPLGAHNVGVQYSQRDNGAAWAWTPPVGYTAPTAAQLLANWTVGGGKHVALVYDYTFSKRTQLYAYYSSMKNETGGKLNTPAIGIIHRF